MQAVMGEEFIYMLLCFGALPLLIIWAFLCRSTGKSNWLWQLFVMAPVIIVVLIALAFPNFYNFQCKSKQSGAKQGLGTIAKNEEAYFSEHNIYSDKIEEVGCEQNGRFTNLERYKRYNFKVELSSDKKAYKATASSRHPGISYICGEGDDVWTINEKLQLRNSVNACNGDSCPIRSIINSSFVYIFLIIPFVFYGLFCFIDNKYKKSKKSAYNKTEKVISADNQIEKCPICGSTDIVHGSYIEDGSFGDWCPHCKKSLQKMSGEI